MTNSTYPSSGWKRISWIIVRRQSRSKSAVLSIAVSSRIIVETHVGLLVLVVVEALLWVLRVHVPLCPASSSKPRRRTAPSSSSAATRAAGTQRDEVLIAPGGALEERRHGTVRLREGRLVAAPRTRLAVGLGAHHRWVLGERAELQVRTWALLPSVSSAEVRARQSTHFRR